MDTRTGGEQLLQTTTNSKLKSSNKKYPFWTSSSFYENKIIRTDGKEIRIKAEGFLARVLQHEIDHTNGIVFIDHIKNKKDAFYKLDSEGELQSLDYEKKSKTIIFFGLRTFSLITLKL